MNDKGFSLIELVVVIVILGIASVGLMTVFSTGTKRSADPLLENQALQLAQEKLDVIVGDRMNPARGFTYFKNNLASTIYPAESPVAGFPGFSRAVTTFCVNAAALNTSAGTPPACASDYIHVTVTVSQAVVGSVTLETLVANY